jgi:zinc resistance-associated protein
MNNPTASRIIKHHDQHLTCSRRGVALYFGIQRCHQEVAMMKTILAGTVALSLAGAGLALAQQGAQQSPQPDAGQSPQQTAPRWRPGPEDISAFTDARIAGLKAGLKLTTEQEKNWPAIETAIRELAKQRADRMKERADRRAERREARASGNEPPRQDAIERLRRGADAMSTRAAALKRFADAAEPLYRSLDDGQKRRFGMLLRMGAGDGLRGRWHRRG